MNDFSTLNALGQRLTAERERLGLSVDDIVARTKLHRKFIEAIDSGEPEKLPSGPYRKAFYRDYARAVGLRLTESDAAALDAAARSASLGSTEQAQPRASTPSSSPKLGVPRFASRVTEQTAQIASHAAKSAAKTTGSVIRTLEEGTKETLGALTSRDLWDEAEEVRRERLGLAPREKASEQRAESAVEAGAPGVKPVSNIPTASVSTSAASVRSISATLPSVPRVSEHSPGMTGHLSTEKERSVGITEADPTMAGISIVHEGEIVGMAAPEEGNSRSSASTTKIVIIGVLLLFAAVAFFAMRQTKHERTPDQAINPDLVAEEPVVPASSPIVKDSAAAPSDTARASSATGPLTLQLRAKENVWVSVTPDVGTPFRGEMKAGDIQQLTADKQFMLNIGNTKALDITFNGEPLSSLPTIKNSGIVARNLVLTRDRAYIAVPDTAAKASPRTVKPKPLLKQPSVKKPTIQIPYAPGKQPAASTSVKPASKPRGQTKTPARSPNQINKPHLNRNTTIPTVEPTAPKAD